MDGTHVTCPDAHRLRPQHRIAASHATQSHLPHDEDDFATSLPLDVRWNGLELGQERGVRVTRSQDRFSSQAEVSPLVRLPTTATWLETVVFA